MYQDRVMAETPWPWLRRSRFTMTPSTPCTLPDVNQQETHLYTPSTISVSLFLVLSVASSSAAKQSWSQGAIRESSCIRSASEEPTSTSSPALGGLWPPMQTKVKLSHFNFHFVDFECLLNLWDTLSVSKPAPLVRAALALSAKLDSVYFYLKPPLAESCQMSFGVGWDGAGLACSGGWGWL